MGKPKKKKNPREGQGAARNVIRGREGFYVERYANGRFKKWVKKPDSIRADARQKAENQPKRPGHGHRGDYPKRKRKK